MMGLPTTAKITAERNVSWGESMANFDPLDGLGSGMATPSIPKFIIKMLNENRPSIAPDTQTMLQEDMNRYRSNVGISRVDLPGTPNIPVQGGTVAVIRTDIPGLETRPYGGASPEAIPHKFKGR